MPCLAPGQYPAVVLGEGLYGLFVDVGHEPGLAVEAIVIRFVGAREACGCEEVNLACCGELDALKQAGT